jgi:AraC-like DNA-binding protein
LKPFSKFHSAPTSLAGCLFGGIHRDTRFACLGEKDRVNHFPASPLVTITLVFEGQLHLIPSGKSIAAAASSPALPPVFLTGPSDAPISSWSPGPLLALSIGIFHDAWIALGGTQPYESLPPGISDAIGDALDSGAPDLAWHAICAALKGIWPSCRPGTNSAIQGISDWARAITVRASMSSAGKSIRSYERKLRRLSGQNARNLQFYSAIDGLHKIARHDGSAAPAQLALDAGYADQSHMGRAIKRATGFSPVALNRAIDRDEAFWSYRLLGERF